MWCHCIITHTYTHAYMHTRMHTHTHTHTHTHPHARTHYHTHARTHTQVLLLVVGRWLIGFCFSRRDLAILDDPISEKFYCKRFRREGSETDLEAGQSMLPSGDSEEKLESTDIKTNGTAPKQPESINMTKEMDRCDLWRNMVRNLDAPFPSPRRRVQHREPERDNCVPLGVVTEEVEALETSGGSGVEGVGGEGIKLELPSASKQYLSTEV